MRQCKTVPPGPCPKCGYDRCWHEIGPGGIAHPCIACGYEDAPVKHDPELEKMLRAEASKGGRSPVLPSLPPLGREHEIRYMLAGVERSIAELRSIP